MYRRPNQSAYSIASSALAINPVGTSMPNARLMANWDPLAYTYRPGRPA
jgi:hypothetical protein